MNLEDYFENCLFFSLSRLNRRIQKLAEHSFKKIDLIPNHGFIMMSLFECHEMAPGDLSDILGLSPSTITRFVDKLVEKGYCTRRFEGKVSFIQLTEAGKKQIPAIQSAWKDLLHNYNKIYGKDEASRLNRMIVQFNRKDEKK